MSFIINRSMVLLSTIALLSACGGGGSTKTSGVSSSAYDGTWKPSPVCEQEKYTNPEDGQVINSSTKASLVIKGSSATLDVTEYANSLDCTGANEVYKADIALTYGDDVPNASSVCSNTKKVDAKVTSMTVNGVKLTAEALAALLAADGVPALNSYGLLCTSPDGRRLYFGQNIGNLIGNSESTRPININDEKYLEKQ